MGCQYMTPSPTPRLLLPLWGMAAYVVWAPLSYKPLRGDFRRGRASDAPEDLTLSGTQLAMESTNRYYVKVKDAMIDIYARRCIKGKFFKEKGYSLSKVKTYIKRKLESSVDWYMSPEEAVDLGFADKIITKKEYFDVRETKRGNSRGTK